MTDDSEDLPTLAAGRWTDAHVEASTPPGSTATMTAPPSPPFPPASGARPPSGSPPHGRSRAIAIGALIALIAGGIGFVTTLTTLDSHDNNSVAVAPPNNPLTPAPNGGSGGTTIPIQPTDPDSSVLGSLIVQQSDVAKGNIVGLIDGGTDAVGEPTLDLCNGTYPSEAQRTARRQVAVTTPAGTGGLSTEAVLYGHPIGGADAFRDLRSVTSKCPNAPVRSSVGEGTVTTKFNARPDAAWRNVATVDRLAYDFTVTDAAGESQRSIVVYLKRGRVMIGVYFPAPGPQIAVQGKTSIPDIVNIFAERLAKLRERRERSAGLTALSP